MRSIPLTHCLSAIIDNRGKTVPTCANGIPLIATNCIKMECLYPVYENIRYISQQTYNSWFRSHLQPNDILFVNKGSPGKVAICPSPVPFVIAQDAIGLRANNDIVYWKYLYYYLKSDAVQTLIANNNVGLIIPHFKKAYLSRIMVPILPMEEQIKIGDILYSIDEQIQRNNAMVHKLQVLAHTTYQRWFEQFEFPDEHGKPYKSSGGKMVWNDELKHKIPDTWNSSTLGASIIECPKSSLQVNAASMTPDGYPFFTSGDNVLTHNEWIVDGAHCFLNTGGNADVKFWLGKAAYSTDTWCIHFGQFTFLYYEYLQDLKQHMDRLFFAGSGLKHLQKDILRQRNVLLPPKKILNAYNYIASSCYQQIGVLLAENNNLSNLKTKLLPLLMNGQLCV